MEVIKSAITRANEDNPQLAANVAQIIERVRREGDAALVDFNTRFDGNTRRKLQVTKQEIQEAYEQLSPLEIDDLKAAAANIQAFAKAQLGCVKALEDISPTPGTLLGHRVIPVQSCCCYVPGGSYPLYSTALMLAIPARVAGVDKVVACSPTMKDSEKIHPKILVAMDIAGADEIYGVGGAHGIAAFSYGTQQIPAVDIIVGPGNQYVTEAKRQCYGQVGIDFIAGPSEVLIIADQSADPEILAADLLAQAEHDLLAKGILVTTHRQVAEKNHGGSGGSTGHLGNSGHCPQILGGLWRDYFGPGSGGGRLHCQSPCPRASGTDCAGAGGGDSPVGELWLPVYWAGHRRSVWRLRLRNQPHPAHPAGCPLYRWCLGRNVSQGMHPPAHDSRWSENPCTFDLPYGQGGRADRSCQSCRNPGRKAIALSKRSVWLRCQPMPQ